MNQFTVAPGEEWVRGKNLPSKPKKSWKKWLGAILVLAIMGGAGWWLVFGGEKNKKGSLIEVNNENKDAPQEYPIANDGNVSPVSGLSCDDWNRRAIAVMQPSDETARPMAGFTDADMVIEMPVVYGDITRLMGIYICGNPTEVGSLRSARHDYIPLAAGLDAIYVSFGASHFAEDILNKGVIDNINGLNAGGRAGSQYFFRKEGNWVKSDDNAYAKFDSLLKAANDFGYRTTTNFSGYAHQGEAPLEQRPNFGHLKISYADASKVDYDYDKQTNSYLRTWGGKADVDRNNDKRVAPKNIVVMITEGAQMEDQYANYQVGDPWYDDKDSGDAYFYMNGKETRGTWKKDKSRVDSKLVLKDSAGNDIKFVPGQIWVDIIDPGIAMKWSDQPGQ